MTSSDRLAEAAREHNEKCDAHPGGSVAAALAAYDADAAIRDAERAVIDAAYKQREASEGMTLVVLDEALDALSELAP